MNQIFSVPYDRIVPLKARKSTRSVISNDSNPPALPFYDRRDSGFEDMIKHRIQTLAKFRSSQYLNVRNLTPERTARQ